MRRRTFLTIGAAVALCRERAAAATTVRVASVPNADCLGTVWGIHSGIFARHGLDVQLQSSNSGPAIAAAVLGGTFDIGKSSILSLVAAHAKGLPLLLLASANTYDSRINGDGLLVKRGSPLRTAPDFNGKIFAVPGLNDYFSLSVKAWMERNGGDPASVKFIEVPQTATPQAIADGRVDAAELGNPAYAQALTSGQLEAVARPGDAIAKRYVAAAYFCSEEFAKNRRPVLEGFVRALTESATFANTHPAETAAVLSEYVKLQPDAMARMTRPDLTAPIVPGELQPVVDAAYHFKAISAHFDAREMIVPYLLR